MLWPVIAVAAWVLAKVLTVSPAVPAPDRFVEAPLPVMPASVENQAQEAVGAVAPHNFSRDPKFGLQDADFLRVEGRERVARFLGVLGRLIEASCWREASQVATLIEGVTGEPAWERFDWLHADLCFLDLNSGCVERGDRSQTESECRFALINCRDRTPDTVALEFGKLPGARWEALESKITQIETEALGPREEPECAQIREKLMTATLDFDFTESSLYDQVDFIQEFAKVNIVIAADVRKSGIPDLKASVRMDGATAGEVLKKLLETWGLTSRFQNRVLLICAPSGSPAYGAECIDVADVLSGLHTDEGAADPAGEEDPAALRTAQLVRLVKKDVAPSTWTLAGVECFVRGGQLIVAHVPAAREEVRACIEKMRKAGAEGK
ncbi:MAG: hypothetical protein K8T20_08400 [Planctomycetes bacterium]|nr:hypothetical protein [Planctomycetota bacterium]